MNPPYRLPAEWEPHACAWLAWPARTALWRNLDEARQSYAYLINQITDFEQVQLLHLPSEAHEIQKRCTQDNIELIPCDLNDSWARDILPSFLVGHHTLKAVCWQFNGWGEKYVPYHADAQIGDKVCQYIANRQSLESTTVEFVFEGGSLHANGQGIGLTTQSCLLEPKRNPQFNQAEIEQILKTNLALDEIWWLPHGIDGDRDTDGHIDNAACFIAPHQLLIHTPNAADPAGLQMHQQNLAALKNLQTSHPKLELIPGPETPLIKDNGIKLPLSYINFVFCNQAICLPQFGHKRLDQNAVAYFADLFPNRTIVPCPALAITLGGGGLHCITHEQPRVSHE